jgi:TolB-like protein/Tfp pilus assembly protein PilF
LKYSGSDADLKALAEGLSEEVITGLSRFSYLRVIARGSTAKYSSESGDLRGVGKDLGARYVIEGSLRQAGSKLRLAIQLVDTMTGAHLWAENYERTFSPESIFALQDDLVPRIVSTVADQHGILPRRISDELRAKNEEGLTPHEAVLRSFSFIQRISPTEHSTARRILERAVERDPNHADAWAMLAIMYDTEFADEYNPRPNPLERAMAAAQRAVDLAPTHALGYYALAFTYFFRKDNAGFRAAVEQAIVLNPMDGSVVGLLGLLVHHVGEIERGTQMVEAAMQLNPHYPPVFRAPAFLNAYAQGKYAEALELAVRFNMPGFFHAHALRAAALGQLGQREAGQQAVQELLAVRPDFATTARRDYGKWWDAKTVDHLVEGLCKAGLEIPDADSKPAPSDAHPARTASGETRTEEGFWVAVLPFKYSGSEAALKPLAEGLSEETITGLSRFSYLRVIARGSTAKYSSESGDIRAIGKELAARYVMEGNLRQAGRKLRLAVQLVDATTGAHLWAETYERTFTSDDIFALQDDLVPRIVSTIADQYGVLPRSMSEVLRSKSEDQLTPQEAVLRTFSYFSRITPEEHAAVRKILERAVREAPDHADSWAMLSMIYRGEFAQGYNAGPNPLDRALAAAQRAVDLAPAHALGHYALAAVYFFRKEMVPFRVEAERTLLLNPLDAAARAYIGLLTAASGEWDRGCDMVESAVHLNPNCPGYFYFARCWNAYRQGKYEEVLEGIARINMPNYYHVPGIQAAALAQLGRHEEAQKAIRALLALRPDFATAARQEYGKWYNAENVEQVIEGLRKAGLDIPASSTEGT